MMAMRVLIAWVYVSTKRVAIAQSMPISSTGSLAVFSPHVKSAQEALWWLYTINFHFDRDLQDTTAAVTSVTACSDIQLASLEVGSVSDGRRFTGGSIRSSTRLSPSRGRSAFILQTCCAVGVCNSPLLQTLNEVGRNTCVLELARRLPDLSTGYIRVRAV